MKFTILFFSIFSFALMQGQTNRVYGKQDLYNPFDSISFDSIVAYNFHVDKTTKQPLPTHEQWNILKNGLHPTTLYPGKKLSQNQVDELIKTLIDTNTYGGTMAGCFEPHLAFVIYKGHRAIHSINVCFMCNYFMADFIIPATNYYYTDFGILLGERSIRPECGFSDKGKVALVSICEELNMPFCVE